MQFALVSPKDEALLTRILAKLKQRHPGHSTLTRNFYRSLPANDEPPFAIAHTESQILAIYSLVKQLKFTRGMQTVYHTQEILNELPQPQLNEFQRWLVGALEGYKVLALNCTSKNVFQPHQVYMEAKKTPHL